MDTLNDLDNVLYEVINEGGEKEWRMNLAAMTPHNDLASTKYCLADPGTEDLIYQPKGGNGLTVELSTGSYRYEWFIPAKGESAGSGKVQSEGGAHQFTAPVPGEAVLYLKTTKAESPTKKAGL